MKSSYTLVVGLLCIVGGSFGDDSIEDIANVTLDAVQLIKNALELFNEQDNYWPLPRNESFGLIQKLNEYRNTFSVRAGELALETKWLLEDASDVKIVASQSIYEWCDVAVRRLQSYLQLIDKFSKISVRMLHRILIQVLEEGISKMSAAREGHDKSTESFSQIAKNIPALIIQTNADFIEKRDYLDKQIQSHRGDYKVNAAHNEIARWNNAMTDYLRNRLTNVTKSHNEIKDVFEHVVSQLNFKPMIRNSLEMGSTIKRAQSMLTSLRNKIPDFHGINDEALQKLHEIVEKEVKPKVQEIIAAFINYQQHHSKQKNLQ